MKKRQILFILFSMFFSLTFAQTPVAHSDTIRLIKFSPDNRFIITAGDDGMIRLWSATNGNMIQAFNHGYPIKKLFIHPSGKLMFTSNNDKFNCLWNLETGRAEKCFFNLAIEGFTSDGKNLVDIQYEYDRKKYALINLISLETYERYIFPHTINVDSTIEQVRFLKDQPEVFVFNGKNIVKMDIEKELIKEEYTVLPAPGLIAFSGNHKFYVREGADHIVGLQKNKRSQKLEEPLKSGAGMRIWFTDDEKKFVSIFNKEITVFETDSGRIARKMYSDDYIFNLSQDLKFIASSSDGKQLSIKSLETGETLFNYVAEDLEEEYGYRNFLMGIKNFKQQNYKASSSYFTKAVGKVSDQRVYLFRGRAFLHAGDYRSAIEDFMSDQKVAAHRSSFDLARTYAAMDNAEMAIQHLNRNLNSPFRQRWGLVMRDSFFLTMKNNPVWIHFMKEQILSVGEKHAMSAEASMEKEDFREALKQINFSLAHDPRNPDWYGIRGKIYLELGKFEEAVNDYKKELKLDSKRFTEVYKNIAIVYTRKGDLKIASVLLNAIVKKDPSEFHLLLDIAEVELQRYNTDAAFKAIDKYIAVIPDDDEAFYIRANIAEGEESKADINKAIILCKSYDKEVPEKYYDFLQIFQ